MTQDKWPKGTRDGNKNMFVSLFVCIVLSMEIIVMLNNAVLSPDWSTRVKQIAKLWRKASSQDRAPYVVRSPTFFKCTFSDYVKARLYLGVESNKMVTAAGICINKLKKAIVCALLAV